MTVFDLAFIVLAVVVLGTGIFGAGAALIGRKRIAKLIFSGLGVFAIVYGAAWIAVTASAEPSPLTVSDPQCVDNWCVAVEDVKWVRRPATDLYDVTLCIFSRAERTRTSFGAHAISDRFTDFHLIDNLGRRYNPLPHESEISLNTVLLPGQALRPDRRFELPAGARGIGVLVGNGSFGACPMIGECSTSHAASDYVLASGVYRKGSSFLALVKDLKRNAGSKPTTWR